VDYAENAKSTGAVTAESIFSSGAKGSIINHSEKPIKIGEIKKTIKRCNELGLKTVVCVSNLTDAEKVKNMNPWAIAFEDKKLIATGKSVTDYDSKEIRKFCEILKDSEVIPLCGAGITKGEDVYKAILLGCEGVLVSSAISNSTEPERFLKELASILVK
jgi:triosephosphate isomerase